MQAGAVGCHLCHCASVSPGTGSHFEVQVEGHLVDDSCYYSFLLSSKDFLSSHSPVPQGCLWALFQADAEIQLLFPHQ